MGAKIYFRLLGIKRNMNKNRKKLQKRRSFSRDRIKLRQHLKIKTIFKNCFSVCKIRLSIGWYSIRTVLERKILFVEEQYRLLNKLLFYLQAVINPKSQSTIIWNGWQNCTCLILKVWLYLLQKYGTCEKIKNILINRRSCEKRKWRLVKKIEHQFKHVSILLNILT